MKIEVAQNIDEFGDPEEFSWDLYPLVDSTETAHLDEFGLPKIGTLIQPGMVIVGKIAKTLSFDPTRQPSALEIQGLSREEIDKIYGHMWSNKSYYANMHTLGFVESAYMLIQEDGRLHAFVCLREAP